MERGARDRSRSRGSARSGLAFPALTVAAFAFGAALRIGIGLTDPAFDTKRSEPMLKSDPALLYYIVERILESGGLPPPDFRADPRIEHPLLRDVPAMFSVGQEFVVAWSYAAFGGGLPLHVFCVVVMGVWAALAVFGVHGLARELTGDARWGAFAAWLYVLSPASYRSAGMILLREDFALPWFALHLWLLARAARVRTPAAYALAAGTLGLSLATWHAMTFVAAAELACVFAWFLRSGRNPLADRGAWALPAVLSLFALGVPVLRAKLFLLSPPMGIVLALWVAAAVAARRPRALACGALAALALVSLGAARLAGAGLTDYAHVFELAWSKLRFAGALPDDPRSLSFGARLLWQGPFESGTLRELVGGLLVSALLLPVGVVEWAPRWWRGRDGGREAVLVLFAVICALLALLVRRNVVLAALVAPVIAAALLRRAHLPRTWPAGLMLAQVVFCAGVLPHRQNLWYFPVQQREIAAVVDWIGENLRDEGAVAADFVNSTAILAHTRHPMLLQPKYETRASRDRIEAFLSADPGALGHVPGFRLLYRSPFPSDMMRVYAVR